MMTMDVNCLFVGDVLFELFWRWLINGYCGGLSHEKDWDVIDTASKIMAKGEKKDVLMGTLSK